MRHAVCTLLLWLITMVSLMASPPVEVRDSILLLSPIDLKTTGETGDSLLWDFSQVSLGKHPSKLYLFADSLGGPSAIFSATHYQLSVHSDTLMLRGIEDKSLRITYSRSPVLLSAPCAMAARRPEYSLGMECIATACICGSTGIIPCGLMPKASLSHLTVIPCVQSAYTCKMFTMLFCPRSTPPVIPSGKSGLPRIYILGIPLTVPSPLLWLGR